MAPLRRSVRALLSPFYSSFIIVLLVVIIALHLLPPTLLPLAHGYLPLFVVFVLFLLLFCFAARRVFSLGLMIGNIDRRLAPKHSSQICQLFGQTIVLQIAVAVAVSVVVVRIVVATAADVVVYLTPQHSKAKVTVESWVECFGNEACSILNYYNEK